LIAYSHKPPLKKIDTYIKNKLTILIIKLHGQEKCIVCVFDWFFYCNNDVRPRLFKVCSTVSWLGALRTWTFGGGTGIARNTFVKWVVGICTGRGGGASRMTIGACSCGGGGWMRT